MLKFTDCRQQDTIVAPIIFSLKTLLCSYLMLQHSAKSQSAKWQSRKKVKVTLLVNEHVLEAYSGNLGFGFISHSRHRYILVITQPTLIAFNLYFWLVVIMRIGIWQSAMSSRTSCFSIHGKAHAYIFIYIHFCLNCFIGCYEMK